MTKASSPADLFAIENLSQMFGGSFFPSPFGNSLQSKHFINDSSDRILLNVSSAIKAPILTTFEAAGPRAQLFWDTSKVRVALVTCGGLAPGLNNVIQNTVTFLYDRYHVRQIFGVPYGFHGFTHDSKTKKFLFPWHQLNSQSVQHIDTDGGSILGTSRGHSSASVVVDALELQKIDVLFVIGGDGTLTAGSEIFQEIKKRNLKIGIIGIPKTIDNDIPWVSKTFGFGSAVEKAVEALRCAQTEARSAYHGIGMVRLMGRNSGALTATAAAAMNDIDFVIIPEVPLKLEGENGFINILVNRVKEKKYVTIALAEGAGQHLFSSSSVEHDPSGNVKLKDIGQFLKKKIEEEFKALNIPMTLKYIDPSYMLRSQTTTAEDSLFCVNLSQNSVHAAMSGKTGCFIGFMHDCFTHVPLHAILARKKRLDVNDPLWLSVLASTGQPSTWENVR